MDKYHNHMLRSTIIIAYADKYQSYTFFTGVGEPPTTIICRIFPWVFRRCATPYALAGAIPTFCRTRRCRFSEMDLMKNGWTLNKPYDDDYLMIIWCIFFEIKPRPFGCWIEKSVVNMQTNHLGRGVNWTSHQSWLWSHTLIPPFLFDHKAVFIDHALKVILGGYIRLGQRLNFHSYPHLWLNPDSEASNPVNSLPFESSKKKIPFWNLYV